MASWMQNLRVGDGRRALPWLHFTRRSRSGCSTVVPMPADDLSFCCDLRTRVRLEARPFHIPPRITLSRFFCAGC
jgi:hypothetical protein